MTTVSTSHTAVSESATLIVPAAGETISFALSGTYIATIVMERSVGSGEDAWEPILGPFNTDDATEAADYVTQTRGERFRSRCTAFTSGTAVTTVADGDKVIRRNTDSLGNIIYTDRQSGRTYANVLAAPSLVGSDAAFDQDGQAAAQGGAITQRGGTSSTAGNAGGVSEVIGGTPGSTGIGGAASVTGGIGGSTSGAGGVASVTGGAATAGNTAGGAASVTGGAATGTGAGGAASATSGAGAAGTTGTAGASGTNTVTSGVGGTATTGVGGASGAVTLSSAAGGAASGATGTGGAAGAVSVTGGVGGATTDSATGVETGGAGGTAAVTAGAGGAIDNLSTGTAGAGGDATLSAGAGGAADAASSTGGAAGDVVISAAAGGVSASGTAGADGKIIIRPIDGQPIITKAPAPTSGTTSVNATEAEMLGGIHVKTPSAGQNWQLPNGTEMDAAIGAAALAVGDTFDFTMINLGTTGDIVTITTDTGFTVVGYMGVHPATDGATLGYGAGHFRARRTAANTWVLYRVG